MSGMETEIRESELDRVRELTSIGAGHAATALARLVGDTCRMRVPTVRLLHSASAGSSYVSSIRDDEHGVMSGIFFEVEGGLGGIVALLFSESARDQLVETLTGQPPDALSTEAAESAIRELGNILVSHVVSAMADTLGVVILPSIPVLAMEDALSALTSLISLRGLGVPTLRVETEISDRSGRHRGMLVFVPDSASLVDPSRRRGSGPPPPASASSA